MCCAFAWLGPILSSSVYQHDVTSHCVLKLPVQIGICGADYNLEIQ